MGNTSAIHACSLLHPCQVSKESLLVGCPDIWGVSGCLKFSAGFGKHITFFRAKVLIFKPLSEFYYPCTYGYSSDGRK